MATLESLLESYTAARRILSQQEATIKELEAGLIQAALDTGKSQGSLGEVGDAKVVIKLRKHTPSPKTCKALAEVERRLEAELEALRQIYAAELDSLKTQHQSLRQQEEALMTNPEITRLRAERESVINGYSELKPHLALTWLN